MFCYTIYCQFYIHVNEGRLLHGIECNSWSLKTISINWKLLAGHSCYRRVSESCQYGKLPSRFSQSRTVRSSSVLQPQRQVAQNHQRRRGHHAATAQVEGLVIGAEVIFKCSRQRGSYQGAHALNRNHSIRLHI